MTEERQPAISTEPASTRARGVAEVARSFAAQTEAEGRVHPAVLAAMQEAGLPQLLKPGANGSIREFVDVCAILAEGCVSSGWCNFVWGMHNYLIGLYPEAVQHEVWADPNALVAASLGPAGKTDRVTADGAIVAGRWRFASGCDHAAWVLLGVRQPDGEPHLALCRRDEIGLDDDSWQVMGLSGTGSKDVVCTDAAIPGPRLLPFGKALGPYEALLVLVIVGPVIGGAQAAVDVYREALQHDGMGRSKDVRTSACLRLAEASAKVDAARTVALAAADELDEDPSPAPLATARIVRDTGFTARLCREATQTVFEAAGGGSLHRSAPLQRIFRDVTAGCAHARLRWDEQALRYARARLDAAPGQAPG